MYRIILCLRGDNQNIDNDRKVCAKVGVISRELSDAMEWHKSSNDQIYNLFSLYGIKI